MPSVSEVRRRVVGAELAPPLVDDGASPHAAETVESLLTATSARLRAAGVPDPRAEAMLLLTHALDATRPEILAHPERLVDPAATQRFAALVDRRAGREPYAYIVGRREFYGQAFVVDRRVLIPRPETEILVEQALSAIERLAARGRCRPLVVDVGTGSGAIACTLALHAPASRVIAADVSADALAVAGVNRRRLDLVERVSLVRGNLLDWLAARADLVVANLPYLPSSTLAALDPEVARFEPRQALDGGPDGAALIRRLLRQTHRLVRGGGAVLLELDPDQVETVHSLASWGVMSTIKDLAGQPRVVQIEVP